jgi:predicted amidohydrolase
VVLGTVHWEGDELFNSLLVVDVDCTVRGRYAKAHLAERWSQAGRSLPEYKLSAYRAMPIARATENSIFLVMANAPADADDLQSPSQSHGNSKIVHPDGNVLVEAGFFEERLVIADVDLADATGAMALRAVEDETVLRVWMQQGLALVERPV